MPKFEALTPKAIAKKIKAKGLQKLRWYCQMCQKQCRDANGFKCHCESESHQRNMLVFASGSGKIVDQFSIDFEEGMLDILRTMYRNKRVHANLVYNEYIRERTHVHMNATRWVTLTAFVLYLGKSGKAKIDETPKGWYISYIEKDPELLEKQERALKKEKMEIDESERNQKEMEERIKKGASSSSIQESKPSELVRNETVKIGFSLNKKTNPPSNSNDKQKEEDPEEEIETIDYDGAVDYSSLEYMEQEMERLEKEKEQSSKSSSEASQKAQPTQPKLQESTPVAQPQKVDPTPAEKTASTPTTVNVPPAQKVETKEKKEEPVKEVKTEKKEIVVESKQSNKGMDSESKKDDGNKKRSHWEEEQKSSKPAEKKKKLSAVEEIMAMEEKKKEKINRKDYWIVEGIVVKVMNKSLANGKYYKEKGVIKKVFDKYIGLIRMIESGDVLKIDQDQLETVIPTINGRVYIVNGAYRSQEGTLLAINTTKFTASIRLETGIQTGTTVEFDYDDICKYEKKT